jgi:NAD(P)-dependent dehydrogenase (short-subunit alcohol dehydrogenase family)
MNDAPNDGRSGLLDGKVALVVGASRGIGAVTAKALARTGAKVMLAARDGNALDAVAEDTLPDGRDRSSSLMTT